MAQPFITNTILIAAPLADVWDTLTDPERTKIYMFGCETVSLWKVGSLLEWEMMRDGEPFVAVRGTILEFEPDKKLVYTVIDPNNEELPDVPENYLTVSYELRRVGEETELTVSQGDYTKVGMGEERYAQAYNDGLGWQPILEQIKTISEEAFKEWVIKNPPKKEGEGKKKKKKSRGRDGRESGREGRREGRREGGENRGGGENRTGGEGGENRGGGQGGERRQGEGRGRDNRNRDRNRENRGDRKPREQGAEGQQQERKPREGGEGGEGQERKPREGGEGQQGQGGERRSQNPRNRDNRGRDNRNRDRNRENRGERKPRPEGGEGGGENRPPRNDAPPPPAE
jgi:uncharacterized protein YndB with AHSA1/START domain